MTSDFERGYRFFSQWPRHNMLLWARETERGRQSMEIIGRILQEETAAFERQRQHYRPTGI